MVHAMFTELLFFILLTRFVLDCQSESLKTKVDRLSDRLNLLDSKVALDFIALRQDLEEVRQLASTSVKGGEVISGVVVNTFSTSFQRSFNKC